MARSRRFLIEIPQVLRAFFLVNGAGARQRFRSKATIMKAMAFDDLREFVRVLETHGELKRIPFEVDPLLEITEFADRSVKTGGPALLFEKPKGSKVPVLINAFASMRRMEIALGVSSVDEIAARISEFLEMRMPEGLIGKLKMLPKLAEMGAFFPKT